VTKEYIINYLSEYKVKFSQKFGIAREKYLKPLAKEEILSEVEYV